MQGRRAADSPQAPDTAGVMATLARLNADPYFGRAMPPETAETGED